MSSLPVNPVTDWAPYQEHAGIKHGSEITNLCINTRTNGRCHLCQDTPCWKRKFAVPHSDKAGAGRDLISEGVPNLGCSKREFALVKLQKTFEVEEYSLRSFWPQVAERRWGRGERGGKKITIKNGWWKQWEKKNTVTTELEVTFFVSSLLTTDTKLWSSRLRGDNQTSAVAQIQNPTGTPKNKLDDLAAFEM